MNTNTKQKVISGALFVSVATASLIVAASATAGEKNPVPRAQGLETNEDLPGDFSKYFGQRKNYYRDPERKLAKLDLDGDFNYDGTIDNDDPADNGAFQQTPPGLVVGVGELTKLVVRLKPYKADYAGRAKFEIVVTGINRADKSGKFPSVDEEIASVGHVRIWRDASKSELLIDSSDPSMRSWSTNIENRGPGNIIGVVPRTVFVEGVQASGQYLGDIRVLVRLYDERVDFETNPKTRLARFIKQQGFRPSFDHILMTVAESAHRKAFINANQEGVWINR